ncbi:aquaporin-8-like isoform X2 [Gigantopelta aegis]|uniref:aquaporin-8-like isoform X2 n=1 Tax=Gigantopelta aegis TaxID=1735272 RepID=UPI001B88B9C5|nr:aquaporin-8-like isoform X2 [Gigantopelta aegis]
MAPTVMEPYRQLVINEKEEEKEKEKTAVFERVVRPCLAELTGACLFVFIGCMCIPHSLAKEPGKSHPALAATPIALAHGLLIASLVISFGKVSGGHFNPAVTVGVALAGHIAPLLAVFYVGMQLIGGLLGAALCRAVDTKALFESLNGGAHILPPETSAGQGILCEMLLTTLLVLTVIMGTCDGRTKSERAPLAIGFCVLVDILAGINTSGASMNPARSFGPAVAVSVYNSDVWTYHYVYWVGPILGSILAGVLYRFFLANPDKRLFVDTFYYKQLRS